MQAGALVVEPGAVWAEVQAAEPVGVSGAGEPPVSEEVEDLLPGVSTPDITTPHLLSHRPGLKLIPLKNRIKLLKQELETLDGKLKTLRLQESRVEE